MAGPPLLFALVVRNDDSVKTVDDLKGRKIGVSTVGSVTSWIISEVSRQRGWGFAGIEQVPIGENASRVAAVRSKALDGCIVDLASALNYVQRGEGRILLRFGDLVKDFHSSRDLCDRQGHRRKPQGAARLSRGLARDHRADAQDKPKSVEIASEVMGTDAPTAAAIYDELMPMFSDTGRFDPKALAVLRRSFVEMKTLPAEPDMSMLTTEAFLPK